MEMNRLKNVFLMLCALGMGFVGSSVATLVSADGGTIIHACLNPGNGTIYVVPPNQACGQNQTALDWNIQGPQGPQGVQGPEGLGGFISTNLSNANLDSADLRYRNLASFNLYFANLTSATYNLVPPTVTGVVYSNTTCPDGTNSNSHNNTCSGHGMP
jgi:hypothetical protein